MGEAVIEYGSNKLDELDEGCILTLCAIELVARMRLSSTRIGANEKRVTFVHRPSIHSENDFGI